MREGATSKRHSAPCASRRGARRSEAERVREDVPEGMDNVDQISGPRGCARSAAQGGRDGALVSEQRWARAVGAMCLRVRPLTLLEAVHKRDEVDAGKVASP